MGGCW